MNGETLWKNIISELSSAEELQTLKKGLWFRASSTGEMVHIDQAVNHAPSSKISMPRSISKKDFIFVHSCYARWVNGEKGIRQKVSRKSRNTAYIFALIDKFYK